MTIFFRDRREAGQLLENALIEGGVFLPLETKYAKKPIIFLHGIGRNRLSSRNIYFVKILQKAGFTIISKARHLFEESGCLEQVPQKALQWFVHYLSHS